MVIGKWNYEKQDYEPHNIPDDWKTPLYCEDMDEIINCAACGSKISYGMCFTSRELHTGHGLGYAICPRCHEVEVGRENHYNKYNR